jgi:tetratricopeptide (TPR) repeat protein
MQWLLFGALILGTPLALAASSAEVPIEVVMDGCGVDPQPRVELLDSMLRIQGLRPATRYLIELGEYGIDLRIADGAGGWINSEPWAYASEALDWNADAQGNLELSLQIPKQRPWANLLLRLHCGGVAVAKREALERRAKLGRRMAGVTTHGDELAALVTLGTAVDSLWRAEQPSQERLSTLQKLSDLAAWGGMAQQQAAWMQQVIAESILVGDQAHEAWANEALGGARMRAGDPAASAAYSRARQLAASLELPDLDAHALVGQCIMMRTGGDAAAAALCYRDAIAAYAALGDSSYEATVRGSRATALLFLGRYDEARQELVQAQRLAEIGGNALMSARVNLVTAQMARWDGDFERSLALLDEVLALYQQLGRSADIAKAQRIIAQTYELAGEPGRAEHHYGAAATNASQRGDVPATASAILALADLAAQRGDRSAALELLNRSEPLLAQLDGARDGGGNLWRKLAVEMDSGLDAQARESLGQLEAIRTAMQWRDQTRLDALRVQLGIVSADRDTRERLRKAAAKALASADLTLFLDLAEAQMAEHQRRGEFDEMGLLARQAIERGTRVAARVRSPALRHALLHKLKPFAELSLWQLEPGPLPAVDALAALSDLERLRAIEQRPFESYLGDNTLVELERSLADADLSDPLFSPEREALLLRLTAQEATPAAATNPGAAAAASPSPVAPQLGENEALLYLVVSGNRAGSMIFDQRGWRWNGEIDATLLLDANRKLLELLRDGHGSRTAIDEQVARLAEALHWRHLFDSAPSRLAVVLGGELVALPWALLPSPGADRGLLIEQTELAVLQSLRSHALSGFTRLHLGAASTPSSSLPALAQADAELDQVANHWRALPQRRHPVLTRGDLAAALADPDALLHLAAHGRGDRGRIEDAGLWLSDVGGEPVFVSSLRLRRLPVHAALVVLGACETAASVAARSLGVGGVAGSLIDAGADAVIATRWPVSDRVALAFADAFHAALAASPEAPEAALRKAQMALRSTPSARHPTHWAGWFLLRHGPP